MSEEAPTNVSNVEGGVWIKSDEIQDLLEKFDAPDQQALQEILRAIGRPAVRFLGDYETGLKMSEAKDAILCLSKRQTLSGQLLDILIKSPFDKKGFELFEGETGVDEMIDMIRSYRLSGDERDPRADEIIGQLSEALLHYEPQFKDRAVAGILWGSLFFGDPTANPDVDFDFIGKDKDAFHPQLKKIATEIGGYLDIGTHIDCIDLEELVEKAQKMTNVGDYSSIDEHDVSLIHLVLTSDLMDLPGADTQTIKEDLERVRTILTELCQRNSFLRLMIANQVIRVEKDRMTRDRPIRRGKK